MERSKGSADVTMANHTIEMSDEEANRLDGQVRDYHTAHRTLAASPSDGAALMGLGAAATALINAALKISADVQAARIIASHGDTDERGLAH